MRVNSLGGWTAVLLALSLPALAQTPTGAIEGTIVDPSGAVVVAAKVSVTEMATGRVIQVDTDSEGRYAAWHLLPGAYEVAVEAPQFARKVLAGVVVDSGAVVNGSLSLEVAAAGQTVTVTAEAVSVDTARHNVDSIVTAREIANMPLFGRNFLDLAALAPGTVVRDGSAIDPTKSVNYRAVGLSGRMGIATRVQVDGIDVTDEAVGTTAANYSPDSVSEFQVTRSSLDPSTSVTSSGAINIITPSGGNALHGGGFWDYYNQDMGARLQYNPDSLPFHRNRVGAHAAGPLVKDKLFWWVGWERHYQQEQQVSLVPAFPQLNLTQAFPVGVRYADARIDWNLRSSVRLFARFHHDWNLGTGGTAVSPFQNINQTNITTAGLEFSRARATHSFRFGYLNFNNHIDSQELDFKFPRTPDGRPYFLSVGSYRAGWNAGAPQATFQGNLQGSYEGSLSQGRHLVRFGLDTRRIVVFGFLGGGILGVTGTYDVAAIAAVAQRGGNVQDPLEYPLQSASVSSPRGFFTLAPAHGFPNGGSYETRLAWFIQDSIKLRRRLSLNLGVRWWFDTGYFHNKAVPRDPILERWIPGASKMPQFPKDLFSPSLGFAWDLTGSGKTVVRGGFYQAYEKRFMIDEELALLPPGLGLDQYDLTQVLKPDGTPINADGRHPSGDYTDLVGQPIRNVLGTLGRLQAALTGSYDGYKFDPNRGPSSLRLTQGLVGLQTDLTPGDQFKFPYSLQCNIGAQRELRRGVVLTADFVYNRGVGLPRVTPDYERRRDAATLNVANAHARLNAVLAGKTVDEWIAANPTRNISAFGLINDTTFMGLYPDFLRANFIMGGFSWYRALQVSLRSGRMPLGPVEVEGLSLGYAFSRAESIAATPATGLVGATAERYAIPLDNRNWNTAQNFGITALDRTHLLTVAASLKTPGGFWLNSTWTFSTSAALTLQVPNFGGAVSGVNGFFGTDLNGDGAISTTPRPDLLPGLGLGAFGRSVKGFDELNRIINAFNHSYAGQLTPHGKALVDAGLFTEAQLKRLGAVIPTVPLVPVDNPNPFHNLLVTDLRLSRPVTLRRWREGIEAVPFVDFYNLFNHAPSGIYGRATGLLGRFGDFNYNYAAAAPGQQAADLAAFRGRLNPTRKVMIGVRFVF